MDTATIFHWLGIGVVAGPAALVMALGLTSLVGRPLSEQLTNRWTYLSTVVGLIAAITGYYTQENSSLLYNRLSDIIHERCDGLKINIQLKILQALIDMPPLDKANESLSSLASPPKALKERTESSASAESLAASGEDAPTESNSSFSSAATTRGFDAAAIKAFSSSA